VIYEKNFIKGLRLDEIQKKKNAAMSGLVKSNRPGKRKDRSRKRATATKGDRRARIKSSNAPWGTNSKETV